MEWLVDNWYILVGLAAVVAFVIFSMICFFDLPTPVKIKNVKEWLKYAVTKAESELGSGTGQLKLRLVYDWTITNFPFVSKFIPFEMFSKWVDDSLKWMEEKLKEDNSAVSKFIYKE